MADSGNEIASAWVAIYAKMPGVKGDIETQLGAATGVASGTGEATGGAFSNAFTGAVAGAFATVTSKAIDMVAGAVDGAISRVDTLSNFPKVMENLGYSGDEAAASIDLISQSLSGLPTSLDQMAGTVQQLAPLTGGLEEATNLSLALNNALLAGGKPAEQQANAMEQYSQMLAVGKVDMAAWRSMVSAMPGQMDQLAQSLLGAGAGQTELYDALQTGVLGFDDFNAALLDLNANGSGEFASFAEQALASTDGIATSQANLKTAVTRGLADVITELKPVISALTGGLTDAVKVAFAALKDFIGWVGDNKDWLTPLALAVGVFTAGILAMNAASTIAAAGGLAKWFATTKIGTAIQAAFNAVMAANPIMLVVMAIAALVAGLVYFFTQTELGKQLWENFTRFLGEAWANVSQWWTDLWAGAGEVFSGFWQWLQEFFATALQVVVDLFLNWTLLGIIIQYWDQIVAFFVDTWTNISTAVSEGISAVGRWIQDGLTGIGQWWTDFWGGLWSGLQDLWSGLGDIIGSAFQNAINIAKAPINALIDLINGAIAGLNSIRVDIPDWVPGIGGQQWGLNIPSIPRLAEGGIVQARPGGILANIGEGRWDEAVIPLSPDVLSRLGGGQATVNVYPQPGMSEEAIGRAAANRMGTLSRRFA